MTQHPCPICELNAALDLYERGRLSDSVLKVKLLDGALVRWCKRHPRDEFARILTLAALGFAEWVRDSLLEQVPPTCGICQQPMTRAGDGISFTCRECGVSVTE